MSDLRTVARHERAHSSSVLSARSRSADVALTGSIAATVVVPTEGQEQALCAREIQPATRFLPPGLTRPQPGLGGSQSSLVSVSLFAYADVMYATAVVEGKVVRFKLSPALARAHRQNRGKTMTEGEAVAFVEAKRRARALRRARPYLASRS